MTCVLISKTERFIDNVDDFLRVVQKQRFDETEKAVKRCRKELEQAKKRVTELDRIFKRIYQTACVELHREVGAGRGMLKPLNGREKAERHSRSTMPFCKRL